MKEFSTNKDSLRDVLFSLFKSFVSNEQYYSSIAKVLSVDEENALCTVEIIDGAEVEAKLQQTIASGFLVIPAVGSIVVLDWSDNTTPYVSMFSGVQSIIFQDGENGGLIKIEELVSKLNTLESDLNEIKQVFSTTWTPVPSDGGAALKVAAATWSGSQITETEREDLENENFKH